MRTFAAKRQEKSHSKSSFLKWWAHQDLNLGPKDYESSALPTELKAQEEVFLHNFFEMIRQKYRLLIVIV